MSLYCVPHVAVAALSLASIVTALMRLGLWKEGSRLSGAAEAQQEEHGYACGVPN